MFFDIIVYFKSVESYNRIILKTTGVERNDEIKLIYAYLLFTLEVKLRN